MLVCRKGGGGGGGGGLGVRSLFHHSYAADIASLSSSGYYGDDDDNVHLQYVKNQHMPSSRYRGHHGRPLQIDTLCNMQIANDLVSLWNLHVAKTLATSPYEGLKKVAS